MTKLEYITKYTVLEVVQQIKKINQKLQFNKLYRINKLDIGKYSLTTYHIRADCA